MNLLSVKIFDSPQMKLRKGCAHKLVSRILSTGGVYPWADPLPRQTPPSSPRWQLQLTLCILLEWILVMYIPVVDPGCPRGGEDWLTGGSWTDPHDNDIQLQPLQRSVRILLECILVLYIFCRKLHENEKKVPMGGVMGVRIPGAPPSTTTFPSLFREA